MAKEVKEKKEVKKPSRSGKYFYGLGRRKSSIAKVRLYQKGSGDFSINKLTLKEYFPYFTWQETVLAPLQETNFVSKFDIEVSITGGGKRGQSDAIRLGIARALLEFDKDLRKTLKAKGYLTRDPRVKERKKPGLKRARRAPQWSKR